jgi:DNA-directed RNA polymerase specialized sigma24 family protein
VKELHDYLSKNYQALQEMARTIARNRRPDWEELCHETILALYATNPELVKDLIKRKQLRYWAARIMLNQYNSSTSAFHYTYRKPEERNRKAAEEIRRWSEPDEVDHEAIEKLHTFIEQELRELPKFERLVTTVYFHHGHSLNTLADASGISRTIIYKAIKKAKHDIATKYKEQRTR